MKRKLSIGELLFFVVTLAITIVAFLGGLYLMGYMVELIATSIQPEIITIACIVLATILITSTLEEKI